MLLIVESETLTRAPRRKRAPILANHVRDGWTVFYRSPDGTAGKFVTGAETEAVARTRAVAWLRTVECEGSWAKECAKDTREQLLWDLTLALAAIGRKIGDPADWSDRALAMTLADLEP